MFVKELHKYNKQETGGLFQNMCISVLWMLRIDYFGPLLQRAQ
jgi:hypothetical protein